MGYNLLIYGIYYGYNPLANLLLSSWDILEGSCDGFCSLLNLKPEEPSSELAYPTLGKGKTSSKVPW